MQKFLFLFFISTLIVASVALSDKQKESLKKHNKECIQESNIDIEKVKKFRSGDWSDNGEDCNKYWYCMFKKSDVITDDGHLKKDAVMTHIAQDDPTRNAMDKSLDICKDVQGATPQESAYLIMKCFHENKPDHDMF